MQVQCENFPEQPGNYVQIYYYDGLDRVGQGRWYAEGKHVLRNIREATERKIRVEATDQLGNKAESAFTLGPGKWCTTWSIPIWSNITFSFASWSKPSWLIAVSSQCFYSMVRLYKIENYCLCKDVC